MSRIINLRVTEKELEVLSNALEALAQDHHEAFKIFCYRFNTQPSATAKIEAESEEWKSLKRDNELLQRLQKQVGYQKTLADSKVKFGGIR